MASEKILIVSNYFPPETGAAANRIKAMAKAFSSQNFEVEVVCPFPNYPKGEIFDTFKGNLYCRDNEDSISINRLWLWPSKSSNKFIRLLSMLSFSWSLSLFFILNKIPNKVVIQYSPIFVGFTAVFWCWVFRKKVILNVSDLWPLAGLEMGLLSNGLYYKTLEKIELFCYKRSELILGQSREILEHIRLKKVNTNLFLYRNYPRFTTKKPVDNSSNKIKIVYAGLLGVAQGVLDIVSKIDLPNHIEFHIYGSGPEENGIKQIDRPQIHYHGSVNRESLHALLYSYDIAFVPLKKRIYGSVPSKIFEYSRLGLPILYYAGGEGAEIVMSKKIGWVIPSGNYDRLQEFIRTLSKKDLTDFGKEDIQRRAMNHFGFAEQFKRLVPKIKSL